MKHRILVLTIVKCVFVAAAVVRADLGDDIRSILQDKALKRDRVGVEIICLGTSGEQAQTIFQHNASTPLIPASNLKIVTTAAALELLGHDFRFRTVLAQRGRDVAIGGDGDPTLGDAELLRKSGWEVDTVFCNWAATLKKRGVSGIDNVYVDDSVFDEVFVPASWPAEQQHKRYVAQVGGLNLNANCVDFYLRTGAFGEFVTYRTNPRTSYITVVNICEFGHKNAVWLARELGGNNIVLRGQTNASNTEPIAVTVHDPGLYAGTVLAETLRVQGVTVGGQVLRDRTIRQQLLADAAPPGSAAWTPLAVHATPISTVLARANKDSMNLYAEALCKRIGHATTDTPGSWPNGNAAIGAFLQSLGVEPAEFNLDDGSGLSKKNTISANAIARVLSHAFRGDHRQTFLDSLSVAGSDGTLEKRFRDSDLRGRVFGKSGYVIGVSSLSGYVKAKDGQWYAFSILMNGVSDVSTAKQLQERIVAAIDRQSS